MTERSLHSMSTKKDFQRTVIELAKLHGWLVYHRSDKSNPGFPYLVLARTPHVIFAELKTEKGKLTAHQKTWMMALMQSRTYQTSPSPWLRTGTMSAYVWRPSDWDEIVTNLACRT